MGLGLCQYIYEPMSEKSACSLCYAYATINFVPHKINSMRGFYKKPEGMLNHD